MKKYFKIILFVSIIIIGLVIDLVTKSLFAKILDYGDTTIEIIPNFFKFIYVENDGAAYGIFSGKTWFLIVLTIIFIIGFVCYFVFNKNKSILFTCSVALIVSGAIGNLIDRLFFQFVRDFISIDLFSFVFNFADMFITFGTICFALYVILDLIKDIKIKKEKSNNDTRDK